MKLNDLRNAIQHTPLFDNNGDTQYYVENKHDRLRLIQLVTKDPEVMAQLLPAAIVSSMESANFCFSMEYAVKTLVDDYSDKVTFAAFSGVFGAQTAQALVEQINDYINKEAEGWLIKLRADKSVQALRARGASLW